MDPSAVLTALAELAPAGRDRVLDATGGRAPLWLTDPDRPPRRKATQRLAATDALHRDERLLRRGWVFVIGRAQFGGAWRRVCLPLLHEPVRLRQGLRGYTVVPAGDLTLTDLVEDERLAAELEGADGVGTWSWLRDDSRLSDWVRATCAAAGLSVARIVPYAAAPPRADHRDGLVAVARAGLYLGREVFSGRPRDSLRSWATRQGLARTAFAAVYGDADDPERAGLTDEAAQAPLLSPLPLSAAQAEVVRRCRTEPVVVVSGPPGSGKSHTVVAAALDVVGRGGSVLLATQSTHAADVLGELLRRYPGPTPVLFGDAERRSAIEADLAAGLRTFHGGAPPADRGALARAKTRVDRLTAALTSALELERRAALLEEWQPLLPGLMADVPGAFRGEKVPAAVEGLARRIHAPATGAVSRLRRRWARRRLNARLGAAASLPLDRVMAAIEAAESVHAASRLAGAGGTDLAATWNAWFDAQSALAEAVGAAIRDRVAGASRSRAARRSLAALASGLRAGRHRRRQLLATMDASALVRALPLWVGTAADVGELLPPVPGPVRPGDPRRGVAPGPDTGRGGARARPSGAGGGRPAAAAVRLVRGRCGRRRHAAPVRPGRAGGRPPGQRVRPGDLRGAGDLAGRALPLGAASDPVLR
ncbi:MAG TPA: AAA family ATPase [Natronosporangium sp.]